MQYISGALGWAVKGLTTLSEWTLATVVSLRIVVRRDKQISQNQQLVIGEFLFVVMPTVQMCPLECRQSLFHRQLTTHTNTHTSTHTHTHTYKNIVQ